VSARLRLTLWYGVLVLLTGLVLLSVTYLGVERSLRSDPPAVQSEVERRLQSPVREVAPEERPPPLGGFPGYPDGTPIYVLDRADRDPATPPQYVVALPQIQQGTVDVALDRLLRTSGIAVGVLALFSLLVGWAMAGRVLRRVHDITSTATRMSEDTLHERIRLAGPDDELKALADTVDAMLDRLEVAFTAQRDFVANASHELRTPLAIIRTEVDVTAADPNATTADFRAMAETIQAATDRSEHLIDSLLALSGAAVGGERAPGDLATAATDALVGAASAAAQAGVRLERSLSPAPVHGDPALLDRLAANLVDNAIRYNEPGGWVRVLTGNDGDRAWLRVTNTGPVVPADAVARLFERFYRPDPSRSRATGGFGLGLAIIRAVAVAHGGEASAAARPEGGLDVVVELPASAATAAVAHLVTVA
jgi:signal transduction histidine kinase